MSKIRRRFAGTGAHQDSSARYQLEQLNNGRVNRYDLGFTRVYQQYRSPKRKGTITPKGWKLPTAYDSHLSELEEPLPRYSDETLVTGTRRRRWSYATRGSLAPLHWGAQNRVVADDAMRRKAGLECVAKLSQGDFNLGVALGESKQTFNFLVDNAISLAKLLRAARRGRWSQVGKALGFKGWTDSKGAANKWLEYQYGLLPLISDVYAASEVLKKGFKTEDQTLRAIRVISRNEPPPNITNYTLQSGKTTYSVRCVVHARVSNAGLATASSLGLTNPALIAWELTPFSFVIDWFLPIGDFLEACSAVHGLDFISGTYTWRVERELTYAHVSDNSVEGGGRHKFTHRELAVSRVPLTSWPIELPLYWKNSFNTTKAATAIALVRQLAKGRH